MQNEKEEKAHDVGEIKKQRVTMADGRRYLIFYTFEKPANSTGAQNKPEEENKNV
jgi:hypothetical protein